MTTHLYRWRSLCEAGQTDHAKVDLLERGVRADGTQQTPAYTAQWALDATDGWVTRALRVEVTGLAGWSRSLELTHDGHGTWHAVSESSRADDLGAPGPAPELDLSTARDVDLGRCPMTNLMPIRRLGLLERRVPERSLVMAWVDMPSLRVIGSDQYYSSPALGRVRYVSGTRNVDVELAVDEHGMVTHYPDLATLESDARDDR